MSILPERPDALREQVIMRARLDDARPPVGIGHRLPSSGFGRCSSTLASAGVITQASK
jgi:hypothetical protein